MKIRPSSLFVFSSLELFFYIIPKLHFIYLSIWRWSCWAPNVKSRATGVPSCSDVRQQRPQTIWVVMKTVKQASVSPPSAFLWVHRVTWAEKIRTISICVVSGLCPKLQIFLLVIVFENMSHHYIARLHLRNQWGRE